MLANFFKMIASNGFRQLPQTLVLVSLLLVNTTHADFSGPVISILDSDTH